MIREISIPRPTVLVIATVLSLLVVAAPASAGQSTGSLADDCEDSEAREYFIEGCLDASTSDPAEWSASKSFTVTNDTEKVVLELAGPDGTDFDLYVTLDGRAATPKDNDRKSEKPGSTERIVLDGDELSAGTEINVTAYAYDGSGEFDVSLRRVTDPVVELSGPSAARPGESVTFDASGSVVPNQPATYAWAVDGRQVQTGDDETFAYAFEAGRHTVSLTLAGANGSSTTVNRTVAVGPAAVDTNASIDVLADAAVWVNQSVRLTGAGSSSAPGGIESYRWRVDGETLTGETVEYAFGEPGNYTVTLTVTDEAGGTANATATVEVRRADVRVESVEGAGIEIVPDHLFANCSRRVRAGVGGRQPVKRVEFSLGNETVVDRDGSDGWVVRKARLPTEAGGVLTVTAIGVGGAADTESVPIRTARAPSGIRTLVSVYEPSPGETAKAVGIRDCTFVVNYPEVARDIPSIPVVGGDDITVPTNLTQFVKAVAERNFSANFELQYHPQRELVSIGGTGVYEMGLSPQGESRFVAELNFTGYFTLPNFTMQSFRASGYDEAEIYLEDYFLPVPSNQITIGNPSPWGPDPLLEADIDPLDALVEPRVEFRGSISDQFELSTLAIELRGQIRVRGQLGNDCWVNPASMGCFALRAWGQATVQSPYMNAVPFEPKLRGTATAQAGYQVEAPTNLIDDVKRTWHWQWDLSASQRLAPGTAPPVPGERAHAAVTTAPARTLVSHTERGQGPKRTGSPGRALRARSDRDSTPADALRAV